MSERVHYYERPIGVGKAFSNAGVIFKANMGAMIGAIVLLFVVMVGIGMVMGFVKLAVIQMLAAGSGSAVHLSTAFDNFISNPIMWVMMGVLLYPFMKGVLRGHDGRKVEIGHLMHVPGQTMRNVLASVLENFLKSIPALVIAFPMNVAAQAAVAAGGPGAVGPVMLAMVPFVLLMLLLILGIIPFFLFFPFIVVDHPSLGLVDALKHSFRAGAKNYFPMLGLGLLTYIVMGLGACACLVGLLFTVPFGFCCLASAYRQVVPAEGVDTDAARSEAMEDADRAQEDAYGDKGGWDESNKK